MAWQKPAEGESEESDEEKSSGVWGHENGRQATMASSKAGNGVSALKRSGDIR